MPHRSAVRAFAASRAQPPNRYRHSLVIPDHLAQGQSEARERFAADWAADVLAASPPRLSLRDPFALADESRAMRCDFNATGGPTVRLACAGHISWRVRAETQHQQTCTALPQSTAAATS